MQKKTIFLIFLVVFLFAVSMCLAYEGTRPIIIDAGIAIWLMLVNGFYAVVGSTWFQMYGYWIVIPTVAIISVALTVLYYRGKLAIWRYGAQKSSDLVSGRQPAPAPTPVAVTPTTAPTPVVVQEKKEAEA